MNFRIGTPNLIFLCFLITVDPSWRAGKEVIQEKHRKQVVILFLLLSFFSLSFVCVFWGRERRRGSNGGPFVVFPLPDAE